MFSWKQTQTVLSLCEEKEKNGEEKGSGHNVNGDEERMKRETGDNREREAVCGKQTELVSVKRLQTV